MKFNVLTSVRGIAAKAVYLAKDKSPELCFIGGLVTLAAAGYLVWNGKAKCETILEEHKKNMDHIKETEERVRLGEIDPEDYSPKQATADRRHYCLKTAVAFAKVFAPIVLLVVGSVSLFGKSTLIYKGRYLASAAVVAEQNKYISELEGQIGEEVLKEKAPKKPEEMYDPGMLKNPRGFFFDENSRNFIVNDGFANKNFLMMQERYWNDRLNAEGCIFGNQVIKSLDLFTGEEKIRGTMAGQVCGWTMSNVKEHGADQYITFGLDWDNLPDEFFAQPVLLRFNWDKTPIISRSRMTV